MADKAVVTQTTLDAIGQAIIDKGGAMEAMTPAQMPAAIQAIPSGDEDAPPSGWMNDGNTHLWIDFGESLNKNARYSLFLKMDDPAVPAYSGTVFWGDGTSNSVTNSRFGIIHTYPAGVSNVRIDIVTDSAIIKGGSNNNNIFDKSTNVEYLRCSHVEVGSSVTTIGAGAFKWMGMSHVRAKNVRDVGQSAFEQCPRLARIDCDALKTIGGNAFRSDGAFRSIDASHVTTIGASAFYNCLSLTDIDIGSLVSIGTSAFAYCRQLRNIVIPEGVDTIPASLFTQVKGLTYIDFPSTVTSMGANVFQYYGIGYQDSSHWSLVVCRAVNPPTIESTTLDKSITDIYVPAESVEAYKTATNWSAFASKISAIPAEYL